jgi:hypothetical protein
MAELKQNHFVRIVKLVTGDNVLCLFGDVKGDNEEVVGYRLIYPYVLTLGEANEKGDIAINYTRFCPYSPVEEHRISGSHIISVVFPDNGVLDNYVNRLIELGVDKNIIFFEENTDGDSSEPTEAGE